MKKGLLRVILLVSEPEWNVFKPVEGGCEAYVDI